MKITIDEIENVFNGLIEEKISREDVATWALTRQLSNDENNLEFEPQSEEKRIWRCITYLMGVDLKDPEEGYLHSTQNFIDFWRAINGKK